MHGGSSHAIGLDNPNFKSGRYSKYLPSHMAELYEEALSNPELLEMADHIALLESRIQTILTDYSDGDPVPRWVDVKESFDSLAATVATGDPKLVNAQFELMAKLLDAGTKWDSTWTQVVDTMEQLRRMTDTEVKRKRELNQMVPIERVMILMAAVGAAVKRNVTNPLEIDAVHQELTMLVSTNRAGHDNKRQRLGPEFIDVSPESRGVKGGGSKTAKEIRQRREKAADAPIT